ncbi:MAG: FAD-dependent oxidoreductase [Eubacteriaceae bacterium]|jgi:dihydrolipoamide dehydrogenase|nr:FAD-dependent oxidoreductase [Eubacteriaceae bacterium]
MGEYIAMPKLDMSMENGSIVKWLVKEGDLLNTGDNFVEVETGKVSIEVDSTAGAGTVLAIYFDEGDSVECGTPLLFIGRDGETAPPREEAISQKSGQDALPAKAKPAQQPEWDFDLAVIGAGPAGYSCAVQAKRRGMRVALFDAGDAKGFLPSDGRLTLNAAIAKARAKGCKWPLHANRIAAGAESAGERISYATQLGVRLVKEAAWLPSVHTVATKSATYTAASIVFACGAQQAKGAIRGDGSVPVALAEEALRIPKAPKRAAIGNCGAVGLEIAYLLRRCGTDVAVHCEGDSLLEGFDGEAESLLARHMEGEGIQILYRSASAFASGGAICFANSERIPSDLYLAAPSRTCSGVDTPLTFARDENGFYKVNEFFETSISSVYAIGAAIGRRFTEQGAAQDGRQLADSLCGQQKPLHLNAVPECVYAPPEAAWLGLTERAAKLAGIPVKVARREFQSQDSDVGTGFVKVVADSRFDEIVGVHIVGKGAPDIIAEAAIAVNSELCCSDVASACAALSTFSFAFVAACEEAASY